MEGSAAVNGEFVAGRGRGFGGDAVLGDGVEEACCCHVGNCVVCEERVMVFFFLVLGLSIYSLSWETCSWEVWRIIIKGPSIFRKKH